MKLTPFEEEVQVFLQAVDRECQKKAEQLNDHITKQLLAGAEEPELDEEDQGWSSFLAAFGLMYNKLVELGVIRDVVLIGENQDRKSNTPRPH